MPPGQQRSGGEILTWATAPRNVVLRYLYVHQKNGGLRLAELDYVYAPAHPVIRPTAGSYDDRDVEFEVRAQPDGTRFLPVFTTLDRLIDALGPAQPWALLPLRAVRALMALADVPQVVLDPVADADAWRWQADDVVALAEAVKAGAERRAL